MIPRVERLQSELGGHDVPAMLVTNPVNMRYLTGFSGDVGLLVITGDAAVLAVDPRYTEQAQREARGVEVIEVREGWGESLAKLVSRLGLQALAVESDHLTLQRWEEWRALIPDVTLTPIAGLVARLRMVKDADEIAVIEAGVALTDEAFAAFREWLRPGVTEVEGAWFIESYMRTHGAEAVAFDLIVAGGANAAMAHARPGARPIGRQETIVIDIGARIDGYHSDLTRTLWIGAPDARFEEVYGLVLSAQEAAEGRIGPGITGVDADATAREVIAAGGYGEAFGHGLGHGVGLAIHEGPSVSSRSKDTLQPGHAITIEPGIYIPGWGGVRIEDLAVVTDDGIRILTKSDKTPWIGH